jgi:trehalose-6-phosphatase
MAAYLGDDATDEDAFVALNELSTTGDLTALPVLVRSSPRTSAARMRLNPPGELLDFLSRWKTASG